MKEQLIQIAGLQAYGHGVVEAGHFYGDSQLDELGKRGIAIGIETIAALRELGLAATPVVLVDNFHSSDDFTAVNLAEMREMGYDPIVVYEELDFEQEAWGILDNLKSKNKVKTRSSGTQNLRAENVPQLVSSEGILSCSILDAAVYKKKHEEFQGICITVLPEADQERNYIRQQSYTRAIMQAADITVPILNIFYNSDGKISVDFDY